MLALFESRDVAALVLFFLYSIPCEFLVSLAPHEPAVLYMARHHSAATVALTAGAGTFVAEALNLALMRRLGGTSLLDRARRGGLVSQITRMFGRAPFAALWVAAFLPVVPFLPFRALAILHRYPRGRFLVAAVSARTVRFYIVALMGAAVPLPTAAIGLLLAVIALGVTLPGIRAALRPSKESESCASSP